MCAGKFILEKIERAAIYRDGVRDAQRGAQTPVAVVPIFVAVTTIVRNGSQPSRKGSSEYFTGTVRDLLYFNFNGRMVLSRTNDSDNL